MFWVKTLTVLFFSFFESYFMFHFRLHFKIFKMNTRLDTTSSDAEHIENDYSPTCGGHNLLESNFYSTYAET